jgi:hypothetical protein
LKLGKDEEWQEQSQKQQQKIGQGEKNGTFCCHKYVVNEKPTSTLKDSDVEGEVNR